MSLVSVAMRKASDGGLDKIVAGTAALVAAVAVFLMPAGVLEQAVLASGLPDMLPQLSPPLGLKSRAGLALLSAGSAFGSALLMMRVLGFFTKARGPSPVAMQDAAPRIRRRDRHPDAPARAPLSISDLGEPAFEPEPEPIAAFEPEPAPFDLAPPRVTRPASRRRAPLIEVVGDIHDVTEPAPAAAEEPRRIKPGRFAEEPEDEPVTLPEPVAAEEPAIEAEPFAEKPIMVSAPEPEPEPEPEPRPVVVARVPAQPSWMVEPEAAAPAQESLADLLARFERAIERKAADRRASDAALDGEADDAGSEDGMDLRLRSALENLRRFAPSRG